MALLAVYNREEITWRHQVTLESELTTPAPSPSRYDPGHIWVSGEEGLRCVWSDHICSSEKACKTQRLACCRAGR